MTKTTAKKADLEAVLAQLRSKEKLPVEAQHAKARLENKLEAEDVKPRAKAKKSTKVTKSVQDAVDQYLQTHSQYKKLEAELASLKEAFEPYMEENGLSLLAGSQGGAITRTPVERPPMNARYTSFEPDEVLPLLGKEATKKCIVQRVDKEALEACHKLGLVPDEVMKLKVTKTSYQIRTK